MIGSGDGAGQLSVLGRLTNLDSSERKPTVLEVGVAECCFDIYARLSFFFLRLSDMKQILNWPLNPNNQSPNF